MRQTGSVLVPCNAANGKPGAMRIQRPADTRSWGLSKLFNHKLWGKSWGVFVDLGFLDIYGTFKHFWCYPVATFECGYKPVFVVTFLELVMRFAAIGRGGHLFGYICCCRSIVPFDPIKTFHPAVIVDDVFFWSFEIRNTCRKSASRENVLNWRSSTLDIWSLSLSLYSMHVYIVLCYYIVFYSMTFPYFTFQESCRPNNGLQSPEKPNLWEAAWIRFANLWEKHSNSVRES